VRRELPFEEHLMNAGRLLLHGLERPDSLLLRAKDLGDGRAACNRGWHLVNGESLSDRGHGADGKSQSLRDDGRSRRWRGRIGGWLR